MRSSRIGCTLSGLSPETPSLFRTGQASLSGTSRVSGQGPTATHVASIDGSRTSTGSGPGAAAPLDAPLSPVVDMRFAPVGPDEVVGIGAAQDGALKTVDLPAGRTAVVEDVMCPGPIA